LPNDFELVISLNAENTLGDKMEKKTMYCVFVAVALVLLVSTAYAFQVTLPGIAVNEEQKVDSISGSEKSETPFENLSGSQGVMTTSGTATIYVNPDEVQIQVGVEVQKDNAADAEREVARIMSNIRESLNKTGIQYELETGYYSIYPRYDYSYDKDPGHYKDPEITGYTVTHTIIVKSGDIENIGRIIDAVSSAGANKVNSISFTLSDEKREEATRLALASAAKNAKAKADSITSALGVSIKRITRITENSYSPYPYVYYGERALSVAGSAAESPTNIEHSDISVTATVGMEFEFGEKFVPIVASE